MANSETRLPPSGLLMDYVPLPCYFPEWRKIQASLQQLLKVSSTDDLLPALGRVYHAAHPTQFSWHIQHPPIETAHPFVGLGHFLEHVASVSEQETFFRLVLPTIAELAGQMDKWSPPDGIPYSVQQQESLISLDRRLIASIIANAFLCTFPKQQNQQLNSINFEEFFQFLICSTTRNSQAAKLRCLFSYFERLSEIDMEYFSGQVSYIRQVLPENGLMSLEDWVESKANLCPLTVRHTGLIEDAGSQALQVDFANRFIGGSTLLSGRQQEEIRFCTCPELLASVLFVESLQDNEAIVMTGYEQFSSCSGYSSTLRFKDGEKMKVCKDSSNTLIAIDAMPWSGFLQNQLQPKHILRELNKAYVGFCYPKPHEMNGPNSQEEEVDSSSFQDALDHSLLSTDGTEFETASSGDGHSWDSSCSSSLQGYSSSLSRAITDIAIKNVSESYASPSLAREESSHNSLSTMLTMSDASTPVKDMAYASDLQAKVLENFATGLIQDAMKDAQGEVISRLLCTVAMDDQNAFENGIPAVTDGHITPSNENLQFQVKALVDNVISTAVDIVQSVSGQKYLDEGDVGQSASEKSVQISHILGNDDDLEEGSKPSHNTEVPKTLPVELSNSQVIQRSQGAESQSSKGSLADFSVISSCPSSDSFVQINSDTDMTFGQRNANQTFSPDRLACDIVQDALTTLYGHIHLAIPMSDSNYSLDMAETPSEEAARDHSDSFDILTSGEICSNPYLSDFFRATFTLDGLAEDIMSSAFQQLHQILQDKNSGTQEEFMNIDTNGNQKSIKSQSSKQESTLKKSEEKDDLHLTKEDIRNGNTLLGVGKIDHGQNGTKQVIVAEEFVEKLVSEALQDSVTEAQAQGGKNRHENTGTSQPSVTQPVEIESYFQTSQSFDKSLVTISEQPVIEEPHFFEDKRLSADSSGTESSQSREARIRECAEQLVARTLPESMKLLGGSAQTTSSSSSRRTSSPRSSIPNSSNRSSMDCFTEDLLKIGNIDPMGKRPSRTEESLAFFAQEIKRMAEAEEKLSKKKKEDFADFNMELQRGSVQTQPEVTSSAPDCFLDNLAERCSVQVISDSFLHLYSKPWSEAKPPAERGGMVLNEQKLSRRLETLSDHSHHPKENAAQEEPHPQLPSEQDLLSMATNLANSIIEAALQVFKDKRLLSQSPTFTAYTLGSCQDSPTEPRSSNQTNEDAASGMSTLQDFAKAKACVVIDDALLHLPSMLKEGEMVSQGQLVRAPFIGRRAIATGNWGCGAFGGDPQLKSLIQWMVASQVQCPHLIYFTFGDERVSRLHRLVSEVTCRDWTVGDLMKAVLDHSWLTLNVNTDPMSLFERIIGSI